MAATVLAGHFTTHCRPNHGCACSRGSHFVSCSYRLAGGLSTAFKGDVGADRRATRCFSSSDSQACSALTRFCGSVDEVETRSYYSVKSPYILRLFLNGGRHGYGYDAAKLSRLDLRMTAEQKRCIEAAAGMSGMSVSQWSLGKLMESARKDMAEQHASDAFSAESFITFARLLDEPANPAFEAFGKGATRWMFGRSSVLGL